MNRKLVWFLCVFFVVLALGLVGGIAAQGGAGSPSTQSSNLLLAQPELPAYDLGQPGLSYRFVKLLGVTDSPYISDTAHINRPNGLHIDAAGNFYVSEEQGFRVLKFDSAGNNLLVLGQPRICSSADYLFCTPGDVVSDASGNFWVAANSRISQYDVNGQILQHFPADEIWRIGTENDRFDGANGIALDNADHLYVADAGNQRIQVYDLSSGSPVYSTTIGVTGVVSSTLGYFNNPLRVAVDSAGRVFVADRDNNRVQACEYNGAWICQVLDDLLGGPHGVVVDTQDNIYIADTYNDRIRKCLAGGGCADFATGTYGFADVALDASGNVYGAAPWEAVVVKYNSSGVEQGVVLGELFVPYLTDAYHFNGPRVAVDDADNLLILEGPGQRLIKFDANGDYLWQFGVPGVGNWGDNDHLNWPHGVAVDLNGKIYVADACRVQIISPAGSYLATLGTGCGVGNMEFGGTLGVAVGDNGYIYVADYENHRVQVFDDQRFYFGSIGVTGECGNDNAHLCNPVGVDVDSNGDIYIADAGNNRVQKYNSSLVWQMTIGAGTRGEQFDQFAHPEDVEVDDQGRIFISDLENNRIQVYDADGAYLTTIGGSYGNNPNQYRGVCGVGINSQGSLYIADCDDFRIQVYAQGVPKWEQVNLNGMGDRWSTGVTSLEIFSNTLYAGVYSWRNGGRVWRSNDGLSWTPASELGFTSAYTLTNDAIPDLIVFKDQLYAGTAWGNGVGQIWRSADSLTWTGVTQDGFGNPNNTAIVRFVAFNDILYAATQNQNGGAEIWRSINGNLGSWQNVVTGGRGNPNNQEINTFVEYKGYLYAAGENPVQGAEVWRTNNGTTWGKVNTNGFGDAANIHIGSLLVYNNALYASTRNDTTGAQFWRSTNGTTWTQVMGNGFGDSHNEKIESLFSVDGILFATADNTVTGLQIWRSHDGNAWQPIQQDGFGDSYNWGTLWNSATIFFQDKLYYGTWNDANGGELWRYDPFIRLYLPLTTR